MGSIKMFNQIYNENQVSRFRLWTKYREELTTFICNQTQSKIERLLIIGAGNSDDIDLHELSKKTSHLFLSDIDKSALERAVSKYQISNTSSIYDIDFIGLDNFEIWDNFINYMLKEKTIQGIDTVFASLKSKITNYKIEIEDLKFDFIIISPIYTQLFLLQGLKYVEILNNLNYSTILIEHITNKMLSLVKDVIYSFNSNILMLLKKDKTLIVISDIFEAAYNSEFYKEANNLTKIDNIYKDYFNKYGYGLGDFGLSIMSDLALELENKWFEWPFDKEKCYFVKAVKYRKKG
jgi:hypothetical protein